MMCGLHLRMQAEGWASGDVTVNINGVPLTLKVSMPDYPVKPQVMLPIFQQLSNTFTDIGTQVVERQGKTISCKMGCGACCRQPVPLSEIEIYHVAALVEQMPEPQRNVVKKRFEDAAYHFYKTGWFERYDRCKDEEEFKVLAFEYFSQGIACPFLEDEACSIHAQRPIICREYLVTSPNELCDNPDNEDIDRIELPMSATHGTCRVGRSKNLTRKNFQIMVFALLWAEQYPEPFVEKTGEEWLREFFGVEAESSSKEEELMEAS
jgi:Fe-S-cluster containining protein